MSDSSSTALDLTRLGGSRAAAGTPSPASRDREEIRTLAQEFESMLMLQMLRQMRQSMLAGDEESGLGAGTMTDTIDVELSRALSRAGGFGLADTLGRSLERYVDPSAVATALPAARRTAPVSAGAPSAALAPSAPLGPSATLAPAAAAVTTDSRLTATISGAAVADPARIGAGSAAVPAIPLPLAAPLTSHFGWRQDPFGAGTRFHAGVDIAAAYGRDVPAAAEGRVEFAGEQGGYGQTVVVAHAGGVKTRYAHLSQIDVKPGDTVEAGDILGRVGQTGRSTGPHLHFEVTEDDRPVDPELLAGRVAGSAQHALGFRPERAGNDAGVGSLAPGPETRLKVSGQDADLPHSRPPDARLAGGAHDED